MSTGRDVVEKLLPRLEQEGVAEARVKLEWLVCETLQIGREALDTLEVDATTPAALEAKVTRLERHEPLQYVLGHAPFLECSLLTDPRALIPRPETEELAMRVLRCGALWSRERVRVADVGTGTGCLAITFTIKHPDAEVLAIDVSSDALKLARDNARRNHVADRIEFRLGDLLEGIAPESLDAVISNPPYIATDTLAGLDVSVRDFEPLAALYGGEDGLEVIRRLIPAAHAVLKTDGHLFLEIGDEQGDAARRLLQEAGFRNIEIARDMYGHVRFAGAVK